MVFSVSACFPLVSMTVAFNQTSFMRSMNVDSERTWSSMFKEFTELYMNKYLHLLRRVEQGRVLKYPLKFNGLIRGQVLQLSLELIQTFLELHFLFFLPLKISSVKEVEGRLE